jgi:hypothetical protein
MNGTGNVTLRAGRIDQSTLPIRHLTALPAAAYATRPA